MTDWLAGWLCYVYCISECDAQRVLFVTLNYQLPQLFDGVLNVLQLAAISVITSSRVLAGWIDERLENGNLTFLHVWRIGIVSLPKFN